ncbi:pteridine reductase [Paraferrimonas haliotis]|uniref:Pteridine reductase n=1 Tax=Paraferrimonas haliotis TaxID=2013866 RepID=A0AA37TPI5_9GAMM|nr:pteridine reductase [Paraferrimonas haliotis]GLS84523.1 pteridine reductase [Paraferrimonas haliotis]
MDNKVAFISGASKRLGAATATTLHGKGYDIVLHYHKSQDEAKALCERFNQARTNSAKLVQANLEDLDSLKSVYQQVHDCYGRLDVLINNASAFFPTPLKTLSVDTAQQMLASNALAPVLLASYAANALSQYNGCIINLIDIHSQKPLANHVLYSMSKAALANATLALAGELGPKVRVNGVSPGAILWPEQSQPSSQNSVLSEIPLARCGDPQDIANTIAFLVDEAPYISGQIIAVDGGRTAVGYRGA